MNNDAIQQRRKRARYSTDTPIDVKLGDLVPDKREYLTNISTGGLCFKSKIALQKDMAVHIKVPLVRPVFEAMAKVVWCRKEGDAYAVGAQFLEPEDGFKIRMVEQICDIEQYKKNAQEKEGRTLTSEQAALEWIARFAAKFPKVK